MNLALVNFILAGVSIISAIALVVLWVSALVSVFRNPTLDKNSKVLWILLIFLVNPIGSVIYFFMHGYRGRAWLTIVAFITLILPLILFPFLTMKLSPYRTGVKTMNMETPVSGGSKNAINVDASDNPAYFNFKSE